MNNVNPKVLAVIPARGGSKRLPRKNILPLYGLPLISYTITAAHGASKLTDYLVSSEDDEILEIAREHGAKEIVRRPVSLATDKIRNIDVCLHALEYMSEKYGKTYDIIMLLQPTSPVRSSTHIDEAVTKLWNSDCPTLAAVKGPFQKRDPIIKKLDENGLLVSYCNEQEFDQRTPLYIYNAALYAAKTDYFVMEKRFTSQKQVPLVMDKYHSIDVDDISDFLVAESYLRKLDTSEL